MHQPLEDPEQRRLEQHAHEAEVKADAVQHLHHAVVGVSGVLLKVCRQQNVSLQDLWFSVSETCNAAFVLEGAIAEGSF